MATPRQWEVWYADLREGQKGEQTGPHNVLVLSSPLMQSGSTVVIVAPITSTARNHPWCVEIEPEDAGIETRSWIECDQLQALSPSPVRFRELRKPLAHGKRPLVALALAQALRGALPLPEL